MNEQANDSSGASQPSVSNGEKQATAGPAEEAAESTVEIRRSAAYEKAKADPFGVAIGRLLHRVRDLQVCASVFLEEAKRLKQRRLDTLKEESKEVRLQLTAHTDYTAGLGTKRIMNILRRLERERSSDISGALQLSLFLGLFSAFESFTGDLLRGIYTKKPDLFNTVDRTVPVGEILQYSSFDEFKASVLEKEIEVFRRKSYVEQFESLEALFGLPLRLFARWPDFVEASQRRNLYTHCDGIISDQYLSACRAAGVELPAQVKKGSRLGLTGTQLMTNCELLMEVGLKLGQTLWRKLFPTELELADAHLNECVYDSLTGERWERAVVFGEFAFSQKKNATDSSKKVAVVNYAIALKFSGATAKAQEVLRTVDWSSAALDFKLGEAVLDDRFEEAALLMKRIGQRGDYVTEHAYHSWPLFKDFRVRPEFRAAYEEVYKVPFGERLQEEVSKAELQVQEQQDTSSDACRLDEGETGATGESVSQATPSPPPATEETPANGNNSPAV